MNFVSISKLPSSYLQEFSCGNLALDEYLKKYAIQNEKKNIGRTFVLLDNEKVIGFYSLANASLEFNELNKNLKNRLPKYPIPCIRIARLAVATEVQRKGYGKELLKDAFTKILSISEQTGVHLILVDAKEEARGFYEHYGFKSLNTMKSTFVLPIKLLIKSTKQKSDH